MDIVREEHAQRLLEDLQYKFRNLKLKHHQDLIEERKNYQVNLANVVEKFEAREEEYKTTISDKNKIIARLTRELEIVRGPVEDSSPVGDHFEVNVNDESEIDMMGVENGGVISDLEEQERDETRSSEIPDEGSDSFPSDEQIQESAPSTVENLVHHLEKLIFENPYTEERSVKVDWTFYGPQSNDQDSPLVECPMTFFTTKSIVMKIKDVVMEATTLLNSKFGTNFIYRLIEMNGNRVVEIVEVNQRFFTENTSNWRLEVVNDQNLRVEEDDILIEIVQKSSVKTLPTFILKIKRSDNWPQILPKILNVIQIDTRQLRFTFESTKNSTTLSEDSLLFPYCLLNLDFLNIEGRSSYIQVEHLSIEESREEEASPHDDDEIEVDDADSPPRRRRTRSDGERVEPHRKSRQRTDEATERKGDGMNKANKAYWRATRNNNTSGLYFKAFIVPEIVDGKSLGFFQLKEISAEDAAKAKYRLGFLPCGGCEENRCSKISTFFTSRSSIFQRLWDLFSIYDKASICINIYNEEMTLGHRWNIGNAQSFVVSDDLEPIKQAKFLFINRYRFENSNIEANYRHIEEISVLDDETEEMIQAVKGLTISRSQVDAPADEDSTDEIPPTPYQCPSCEMTFSNFQGFSNHFCLLIFLQEPDISTSTQNTTRRLRSSTTRKKKCGNAQESTTKRHRRSVQDICPFKCSICSYAGKLKGDLKEHMLHTHSNVRNFRCSQCSFMAKSKSNLTQHEKRHQNTRPFKCSSCSYIAKLNSDLRSHMSQAHLNIRNYPCSQCDYTAKTKSCLTKHEKRHQNIRPFKCSVCSYAGKFNGELTRHMSLVHSNVRNFPCSQCSFKAKSKFNLARHKMLHQK